MTIPNDSLVGQRFTRLTVLELLPREGTSVRYKCVCDCGNEKIGYKAALLDGRQKSCGCYKAEHMTKGIDTLINRALSSSKQNAKKKGRTWNLTKVQAVAIMKQDCYYCGAPPSNCATGYTAATEDLIFVYSGIDRVDSSKGYTEDNVVPCCIRCNTAKSDMSIKEFYSWITTVHERMQNVTK